MVLENRGEYPSLWAAIESIAQRLVACRRRCKCVEVDTGVRDNVTSSDAQRMKELERENKQLRRANEILKLAGRFFG